MTNDAENTVDLSVFSLSQLLEIEARLPKELAKRRRAGLAAARRQIEAIAASVGVPLDELIAGPVSGAKGTRPPRYGHPHDPALTWSGAGRKPFWVHDLLGSGYTLAQLEITRAA